MLPTSQASDRPKSRPLSMVAAENAAARSSANAPDQAEPAASRDQMAQALASKDPAWFRQTADRGQNSAAYRRNQVEDEDVLEVSSMRTQLPGMVRPSSGEPETDPATLSGTPTTHRIGSPLALTPAQRLDPPSGDATRDIDMPDTLRSPPSGRTSPTRPVSPTKGLGGFVQSAMMKRSDSVKRWSVTSPAGLQRADSVVSGRTSLDNAQRTPTPQQGSHSRPGSRSRESTSRPTSSHEREAAPITVNTARLEPDEDAEHEQDERTTPPTSPSKTMDPRRWSPTKSSSWLEAALNKPESPKPKPTPPPSNQPAWMVELNKAKAQKAANPKADLARTSSTSRRHEVKTGGLLRSSPMETTGKPASLPSVGGYHSPSTSIGGDKASVAALRRTLSKSGSPENSPDSLPRRASIAKESPPINAKPDTPPKKDFRANLKPRETAADGGGNEAKSVFGATLRPTKTQNYVAPDLLKDNILRGKAGLNFTGGPKPRVKKDELKDAILQKKAEFHQAKAEGRGVATNAHAPTEKPLPEGLVKKMEMSRTSPSSSRRGSATSEMTSEASPASPLTSNRFSTKSAISVKDPTDDNATRDEKGTRGPSSTDRTEASAPGRLQRPGKSALADRFNPALAGILARGPPAT